MASPHQPFLPHGTLRIGWPTAETSSSGLASMSWHGQLISLSGTVAFEAGLRGLSHVQDNLLTAASSIHISAGGGQDTAPVPSKQTLLQLWGFCKGVSTSVAPRPFRPPSHSWS